MSDTSRSPRSSHFTDHARLFVVAGNGGDGAVSFRREKYVPRGGPDGGDGGRGGNVVLRTEAGLTTLGDRALRERYEAPNGGRGSRRRSRGADGKDIVIPVPLGTIVYAEEDNSVLADLTLAGESFVIAKGGRGGRGNARFATSTRRTPRFAERGERGESLRLRLELRLLADVGLIGLPNAGKSTLISKLSAAHPKIASYPFTTLSPVLGVVRIDDDTTFVLADMPGLIEGAHKGDGLGHEFLRHIDRTRLLVHLLDISTPDRNPIDDFNKINQELRLYRDSLANRPQLVVLNKIDLPQAQAVLADISAKLQRKGEKVFAVSALSGKGLEAFIYAVSTELEVIKQSQPPPLTKAPPAEKPKSSLQALQTTEGIFRIKGEKIEKQAAMLDPGNHEAMAYLYDKMMRAGAKKKLSALGAKPGDTILLGECELQYRG